MKTPPSASPAAGGQLLDDLIVAAGIDDQGTHATGALRVVNYILEIDELAQVGLVFNRSVNGAR